MKKNGFAPLIIILVIAILGIVGYFAYKNYSRVSSLTVSNTPTSMPVPAPIPTFSSDTSTWETYTNKTYSYSIKYPKGWFITDGSDQVTIANFPVNQPPDTNKYVMYIGVYEEVIGNGDNLIDWLKQNKHYTSDTYGNPTSTKETTVAGNQAVILNYNGESDFYVFSVDTHVFWAYPSPKNSGFSEAFNLILSTFKFTK